MMGPPAEESIAQSRALYLELLKQALLGALYVSSDIGPEIKASSLLRRVVLAVLRRRGITLARLVQYNRTIEDGREWPEQADTMVGRVRLDHLQACIEDILRREIPGDLIEAGVWRGGASILARGVLRAHQVKDRLVWVADSFNGLPAPDPDRYPADAGDILHHFRQLAVPLESVRSNFDRYGLLDEQVKFVEGWFKDTLPRLAGRQWAVIRLDGDMYESTIDGLRALYPGLSVGGYLIVDDFGAMGSCRAAVNDYRREHGIDDEIREIDWTGAYWQRT